MPRTRLPHLRTHLLRLASLVVLCAVSGCGLVRRPGGPGPQRAIAQIVDILSAEEPSPEYFRQRARLEAMGSELDEILVRLISTGEVEPHVRANAAVLLADRRSPAAVPVLRRILLTTNVDEVRASAVLGLQRLAGESAAAANAIRAAVGDPSPGVRLIVLQALDVEDADLVRQLIQREPDPQVRIIATQLLTLLEARGAPLVPGPQGDLRTSGADTVPRLVFHPIWRDTASQFDVGALWVEMPRAGLVPLGQNVEVVANVVPAFFNAQRTAVVYESERQIRIRDLRSGSTVIVGAGIAPRVIPFTDRFVFLRERAGSRTEEESGTVLVYEVLRGSFRGDPLEPLGEVRAVARPERFGGSSPVRLMVVGEVRQGFVLRGPGVSPVVLPNPTHRPPR